MKRENIVGERQTPGYVVPRYREFRERHSRTATASETIDIEYEVIEPKQIDENQIKRAEDEKVKTFKDLLRDLPSVSYPPKEPIIPNS